jgi:hypothetical protein
MGSAAAMTDCEVLQVEKKTMMEPLHRDPAPSEMFAAYFRARNIRYEEDLVDQLFNSSKKRLARVLLLLAHFGKEGIPETVVPNTSQETLAEMVRDHALAGQPFHEPVPEAGIYSLRRRYGRRAAGPQFAAQCGSALTNRSFALFRKLSDRAASAQQIDDHYNQGDDQQYVNQTAGHVQAKTQEPQNQKHSDNRPKHI